MRSDELYMFNDGTLTRLLSLLENITKNIDMEYLPKRRWSTLEKKRAYFMIKDINKLLKERRTIRSLEKFVGVTRWFSLIVLSALRRFDNEEHAKFDESDTYVLERFDTSVGNPVKEMFLKLNLPDHRSILTDSKEYIKMVMERRSVKVKEFQERCISKAFQDYQIKKGLYTLRLLDATLLQERMNSTQKRLLIIPGLSLRNFRGGLTGRPTVATKELILILSLINWEIRGHKDFSRFYRSHEHGRLPNGCEAAFLDGNLREEVYVSQLDGFVDPDNPNHVYKLKKALYGLKQAPRAWYDMFSSFLISQDFSKGLVDPTLFIRLQISQSPRGIFINQSKYALESLKKYGFDSCDPVDTPHGGEILKWYEDKEGKAIDPSHYRGMIGTLLYLTATFADADHAVCQDTRRSTSGSMQFLGDRLVRWSSKRQKSAAISSTKAEYIAMSKHIDIRFHFIKEHVENGVIELYFVNMEYQLADIFTKALARERIEFLINKLGMRSFTSETLKQLADEVDE
ncbi:retrovirus-related pol polyprotein from transposon TNT 1-94 [Tanacetum coccineum]